MLKIKDEPERRQPHSYYLRPEDAQVVKDLAKMYETTASKIIETMINQYGKKLLKAGK